MSRDYSVTYQEARILLALMDAPGFDLLWERLIKPRLDSETNRLETCTEMTPQDLGRSQGAIRILRDIPNAMAQFKAELLRFVEGHETRKEQEREKQNG